MRVLYYADRFWPYVGGAEIIAASLLPRLAQRGVDFTVVTTGDGDKLPDRDTYQGIPIHRLQIEPALRNNDIELVAGVRRELTRIKEELRPDLMHVALMGSGAYFPVTTAHVASCPILLGFQGSWPPLERGRFELVKRALDEAAWITACSRAALEELTPLDAGLPSRTTVIHNGIDPSWAEPAPIDFERPTILCSARLEPEKGLDLAVRATVLLRDEFPALRLRIAGSGTVAGELAAQAAAAGLDGAVELLGWRSPADMPRLIGEATVVVVPSRAEGFGMIALEAMLAARPVVASRVGGLPEVLGKDGGILVDPESPEAIAGAVAGLLRNPARARAIADAARARALAHFPLDRCVDAHEHLYTQLADRNAS
jgi:glycosyltransferase involved in cell wall biosynthesis